MLLLLAALSSALAQTPALPANSVVNGASFRPVTEANGAIAPGTIVAIFGTNLASETQVALSVPLSTTLGQTSVTFGGTAAPLFFVSATQINAQVPFEVTTGAGTVAVQVRRGSATSESRAIPIAAQSPGIFTLNQQGTGTGAILHADTFQLVSDASPARPGEFLAIFCTGLGALNRAVSSGTIPPSPPPETLTRPTVDIGGISANVTYSGLAPGFVGLYQVNVQVPAVPTGTAQVIIRMNNVPSNTVTIAVRQ